MLDKLSNQEKLIDYKKPNFRGGNNVDYDFSNFRSLRELFRVIYYGEILIAAAEAEQDDFYYMLNKLESYRASPAKYIAGRKIFLINAQNFYDGRKMIINAFKDKIFPLNDPDDFPKYVFSEEDI